MAGKLPVETRVMAGKWSGQDVIFGVTRGYFRHKGV